MADTALSALSSASTLDGTELYYSVQSGADAKVTGAQIKTLVSTAPTIAGGSHTAMTGLGIRSTGAAYDVTLASSEVLTAGRTISLNVADAARTLTISGNATVSQDYSTSGSPQFTSVEVGHATDTTLARSSAGNLTIEGNLIYRAGGTDVPVTDGGTGASDASTARTNLGLAIGSDVQAYNARLADVAGATYAQGDILYHNGTNLVNLGYGTSGYFLKTQGVGANPVWASIPGGGDLLSTNNLSDLVSATTARTNLGVGTGDSPQFTAVNVGHASDTTVTRVSAGVIAVEGVNVLTTATGIAQGKTTIWIPAAAMLTRTTNGAAAGTVELSTNKIMIKSLDFDTTTQEFAQFSVWFPKSWNLGTVTFQPCFSQLTTAAGGVVFGLAGVAVSDGDAIDAALGTAQTSTKTAGTANLEYQGPESSAITIAGTPAAGDRVIFQINRTVSDGSDTLAQDARLHGVRLFYTTNASTDA